MLMIHDLVGFLDKQKTLFGELSRNIAKVQISKYLNKIIARMSKYGTKD
jgi:hypothetical protein